MSPEGKTPKPVRRKAAGFGDNSAGGGYLDGRLLIAMPVMGDPRFERSVIYMCAHSSEGAMGYAGWAPGQLENEIQHNGWLHCDADPDLIFGDDVDEKYQRALQKIGIDPGMLSNEAGHA